MLRDPSEDLAMMPDWARKERPMASMLPYVSLVNDVTIRTRGNALFQCIRLDGVNSMTCDDAHLEKIRALFAAIIAQIGPENSFYVHKVSKAIETTLPPVPEEGFARALDTRWQTAMARAGLQDKTLTLTVLKRPPLRARLHLKRANSIAQLKDQTAKQLRKLEEVVGFLLSSFAEMHPRLLGAESGELLDRSSQNPALASLPRMWPTRGLRFRGGASRWKMERRGSGLARALQSKPIRPKPTAPCSMS